MVTHRLLKLLVFILILISVSFVLWFHINTPYFTSQRPFVNTQCSCTSDCNTLRKNTSYTNGSQPIGDTYGEQLRLRSMPINITLRSQSIDDSVPTVPCLSADGHLLVLSVAASRIRYGVSLTFIMVYPSDVKKVLSKLNTSKPLSAHELRLWCIFDDGSITPAYSYDSNYGNDRASLLDCPLSLFAHDQLWRYNQTLRVYLASTTDNNTNTLILKAFVSVPKPIVNSAYSSHDLLTLCTSPLHTKAKYLMQWIEFHRLAGFGKFVVYNTTDTDHHLSSVLATYNRKYPNLVDVVQWNFSSLALVDVMSDRYFQVEALHDCLIRYGDQSEWLGTVDLDEYIVPLHPYKSVLDYLHVNIGHRSIGSITLYSHFFCTKELDTYGTEENDTDRLIIERFVFRARNAYKMGREKYLYRPRFVQYLSIHHHIVGLSREYTSENHIMFAHYSSTYYLRTMPGCLPVEYVNDTRIRDHYASNVKNAIRILNNTIYS